MSKLQSVKVLTDPRLAFLENYTYDLGQDDLVPFGAQEFVTLHVFPDRISCRTEIELKTPGRSISIDTLISSVAKICPSYGRQVPNGLYFLRQIGLQVRTCPASPHLSLIITQLGFSIASHHVYNPKVSVILQEEVSSVPISLTTWLTMMQLNNTLDDHTCPNAGNSDAQTSQWLSEYGPVIAARLNVQAPGANLTPTDVYNLMTLCPFETVAKNSLSPFCALFTSAEFQQFEYSGDLDKYYNTGSVKLSQVFILILNTFWI